MTQPRLFFSLKTVDKPQIDRLQAELRKLLPGIPYEDLSLGVPNSDNWKEVAAKLIKSADAVICVVGETTHDSEPIEWELREAIAWDLPIFVRTLSAKFKLPAVLDETPIKASEWDVVSLATTVGELLIKKTLFNSTNDSRGILSQYEIMVSSWEALINRRQNVNQLYLGASTAVLTAIGALVAISKDSSRLNIIYGTLILSALGVLLSFNWRQTINSYGILSTAKARVIAVIEEFLPIRLFEAEWGVLQRGAYRSTTKTDRGTSTIFLTLFAGIFLGALLIRLGVWH